MKKCLVAILFFLLSISAGCSTETKYTMEQYYRIRPDMTYEEVKDVLGNPGTLEGRIDFPEIPEIMDAQHNTIYQWKNNDGTKLAWIVSINVRKNHLNSKRLSTLC